MKRTTALLLLSLMTMAVPAFAAQPNVVFGPGGVSILDVNSGTRVAWMSLTRARLASHSSLSIDRGIAMANANGKAEVVRAGADQSRSLWVIAAVEQDVAGSAISPSYSSSTWPVVVEAVSGASGVKVVSPEIELMYVRPNGGAWFVSATDGGLNDGDQQQNASISISLAALQRVNETANPPAAVATGDLLLMIDPRANRVAVIRVGQ